MGVQTAAGSKLYIGPVAGPTVDTKAEYEGLAYVECGEIEDMGEIGDKANEIKFTSVGDRRVRKFKGSFDAGTMSITVGFDPADDGQVAVLAAFASDDDYAFKITLNDAPPDSDGGETTMYFRGKVMSKPLTIGTAENVVKRKFDIGVNSEVLEIDAQEA